jgi:hypothetical protein
MTQIMTIKNSYCNKEPDELSRGSNWNDLLIFFGRVFSRGMHHPQQFMGYDQ